MAARQTMMAPTLGHLKLIRPPIDHDDADADQDVDAGQVVRVDAEELRDAEHRLGGVRVEPAADGGRAGQDTGDRRIDGHLLTLHAPAPSTAAPNSVSSPEDVTVEPSSASSVVPL